MWTEGPRSLALSLGHVGVRVMRLTFYFLSLGVKLLRRPGSRPFCTSSRAAHCADCWLLGCTFSSFFKQALALRHAQMALFSGGHQGYWSFSSLLLLQPCFCWASLN